MLLRLVAGSHCEMTPNTPSQPPAGFFALGAFFFFRSAMATFAAITLLKPGTLLDQAWKLNLSAHEQMLPLGRVAGIPFLVLAVVLLVAGVGWFRRRYWGWVLGVSVIAVNLAADVIHFFLGDRLKSAVGVVIAFLLVFYMRCEKVRGYFLAQDFRS
jgi:uncharacterized membrane protein (DUF2068 family)